MLIVSLDQCYLWNFLSKKSDKKVAELAGAIEQACNAGKIVCPAHSNEMISETIELQPDQRNAIFGLQNNLAKDLVFRTFHELLSFETLKLIRPAFSYLPYVFGRTRFKPDANLDQLADETRRFKQMSNEKAKASVYPQPNYVKGSSPKAVFNDLAESRSVALWRVTEAILEGRIPDATIADWDMAIEVGLFLIRQNVTPPEIKELQVRIANNDWAKIPVLFFHTLMWSKIEHDMSETNRRFDVNDHFDILRLATAFAHANVAGCDHRMKEILKQVKALDYGLRIFSIKEIDQFLAFIGNL